MISRTCSKVVDILVPPLVDLLYQNLMRMSCIINHITLESKESYEIQHETGIKLSELTVKQLKGMLKITVPKRQWLQFDPLSLH